MNEDKYFEMYPFVSIVGYERLLRKKNSRNTE